MAIDTFGSAAAVRSAHREQCFDAIRRTLGLGDTKGDTGLWLDWIDAVAPGKTADEVVRLTMEQKRIEGTLGSKLPPVNWTAGGWRKTAHAEAVDTCAHCGSENLGAFVCSDCGGSNLEKAVW